MSNILLGNVLFENGKIIPTFCFQTVSQRVTFLLLKIRKQVLLRYEEVGELATSQVSLEIAQERKETLAQIRGAPLAVVRSRATGVEESCLGKISVELFKYRVFFF